MVSLRFHTADAATPQIVAKEKQKEDRKQVINDRRITYPALT